MDGQSEEKYLMFLLDVEYYGIPILKVNEIIGLMEITKIPHSADFMKGIINLRGKIIPVMDLRLKFEMIERDYDAQTCIIIVELEVDNKQNFVGLIVDKVAEVVSIYQTDIEMPPEYGQKSDRGFLTGVGKVKDKVVMLLDIDKVINTQEIFELMKHNVNAELQEV